MKNKHHRNAQSKPSSTTTLAPRDSGGRPEKPKNRKKKEKNGQVAVATKKTRGVAGGSQPQSRLDKPAHKAAPAAPLGAVAGVPHEVQPWTTWRDHLRTRPEPALAKSRKASLAPLSWGLGPEPAHVSIREQVEALATILRRPRRESQQVNERLQDWLTQFAAADRCAAFALQALVWARSLPELAQTLEASQWQRLLEGLQQVAHEAAGLCIVDQPLVHQLLTVELPLTLAVLFPELTAFRRSRKSSWKALEKGLEQLLDGNGIAQAVDQPWTRALTACWIRCGWLEHQRLDCRADQLSSRAQAKLKRGGLDELGRDQRLQMEWAVREAIRSSRSDGSRVGGPAGAGQKQELNALLAAGLALTGDREDAAAARCLLKTPLARTRRGALPPEASEYSEWAGAAVLRTGWRPADAVLGVHFGQGVQLDLTTGQQHLLGGDWKFQAAQDGRPLHGSGDMEPYEEVCWFTDDDCDYLELQVELNEGWVLQRQILLGKEDRFLYLAEALVGPDDRETGELSLTSSLPLAPEVQWRPEEKTRDGWLVGRIPTAVLPLYQPEWRSERFAGNLAEENGRLQWTLHQPGKALYAAIWINLDGKRTAKPHTWRRLTVASNLKICAPDEAVAYRVQHGRRQWLTYRSLGGNAIRSVLGQNLSVEFFAGRFFTDGSAKELVQVE